MVRRAKGTDVLFTVVVPLYNKQPHVKRVINSILNQTIPDFEIIIVNDASTDDSVDEVQKFNDSRIRLLHRTLPGPGGYAARNLGVQEANSEWIAFLDADDEWLPEHLENYTKLIEQFEEVKVLGCGWLTQETENTDFNTDLYYCKNHTRGTHTLSFYEYLKAEVDGLRPIWSSIACIKKKVLIDVGGFPEGKANRGGDVDTWLRCVENAGSMAWSPHIGAVYYRDAVNMVTKMAVTQADFHISTTNSLLDKYSDKYADLLKIRSNNLIIFAWNLNMDISHVSNFSLRNKLYKGVQPVKVGIYSTFSILPKWISQPLYRIAKKILGR